MGMMISVWGKNGSGKSTVTSNLACAFAKRGYKTAVIGANRFYGSIQYFFNVEVRDNQSIRVMLTGGDSLSIQDYFTECPFDKNIHIASLADGDDCAGYRKLRVDMTVRFLNLVKKNYPVVLADCDESIEDPLSMYSLTLSEQIMYVTRRSLQSVVFAKAYEPVISGLQIKEQIKTVYIGDGMFAHTDLFAPFGIADRYCTLPLWKEIEHPRGGLTPVMLARGDSRAAARYRKAIYALTDTLISDGAPFRVTVGEAALPDVEDCKAALPDAEDCESTLSDVDVCEAAPKSHHDAVIPEIPSGGPADGLNINDTNTVY
jgi:hypothetical protein